MGKFLKSVKRGVRAIKAELGPRKYEAEGKKVLCQHCENAVFAEGLFLLNTRLLTLVGLDWADKSVTTLICTRCGRIEWFGKKPTRL